MAVRFFVLLTTLLAVAATARGADGVQFFETRIRPVLAEHCYSCHSAQSRKLKANLLLDSPAGLLAGGDSGPSIVPGHPEQSRLIDAILYQNVDLQMPPKRKLSEQQIADLTAWVKSGAPWPNAPAAATTVAAGEGFDLGKRKASHWSWRSVRQVPPPPVKNTAWPRSEIDVFVLAKLEEKGLTPAAPAERAALIRRAYFDLVGLPPTPAEVDAFVNDPSANAFETVVDGLLASPHFGERWGRHWLDLVRYAETFGHEFDYVIPSARQYPLYVIRALNADIPYDQLVREHVAGDLLPNPRFRPTEKTNESVIGSGFWYLGEQVHGPVDVRQHQADRIDNQIDVFGKTFLGLTIACARCHDHKFDAISTRDYYALYGALESTRMQQAFLDPNGKVEEVVARMKAIRAEGNRILGAPGSTSPAEARRPAEAQARGSHPPASPDSAGSPNPPGTFEVFDQPDYRNWFPTGWAFGDAPTQAREWDSVTRTPHLALPGVAHSGLLSNKLRGVLRSRSFVVPKESIDYRLAGTGSGAQVRLIIDGYTMDVYNGVLFPGISFPVDTNGKFNWHRQDTRMYAGHRAHLELIDEGDGWLAIDEIRFNDEPSSPRPTDETSNDAPIAASEPLAETLAALAKRLDTEAQNLPAPARALAVTDGDGVDGRVFIRGSHKNLGDAVPRRFLEAIAGNDQPTVSAGSGRLEIARRVTDPSNPLTARVFVNRVWHHLFGRGIVPTVDDFGVMGEPPTHPELLDHLASRFVREGWSIKKLIRAVVLSSTYQMSSRPSDGRATEADPQNTLLHHMPVRRLEAEAIRDAILAVSGRLDRTVYAPTVDVHLTPFMEGRGRPQQSGPLDGDGRRSVYVAVRRNFLPPMMLAFDFPVPFNTIGRRSVSNVPAQALILLNDPFVLEQSRVWADKILTDTGLTTPRDRVMMMYRQAFSRPPTEQELDEAIAFLHAQGQTLELSTESRVTDPRVWADLAHVLFNVKEFIFVN
jgi:mono/diheme cytochrome c family protein